MVILADLAAPGHCLAAAGLRVGIVMATRHPGVWRWRVGPCDRAQKINATTCPIGRRQTLGDGLSLPLHQRSVSYLSAGDVRVRLIAKGGVEPPGGMAGREAIVQLLGLRSYGPILGARLTEGTRAKGQVHRRRQACYEPVAAAAVHGGAGEQQLVHEGVLLQGKALRCLAQQGGQELQVGQAGLRGVLPPAPKGGGELRFAPADQAGDEVRPGGAEGGLIRAGQTPIQAGAEQCRTLRQLQKIKRVAGVVLMPSDVCD